MNLLSGKTALVTGSSRGIGAPPPSWITGIILDVAGGAVMV